MPTLLSYTFVGSYYYGTISEAHNPSLLNSVPAIGFLHLGFLIAQAVQQPGLHIV